MTRIHYVFLSVVVIVMMIAAGCIFAKNTQKAPPLTSVTAAETAAATPVQSGPAVTGTIPPVAIETVLPAVPASPVSGCNADTTRDPDNCGGCGYKCPAHAFCRDSRCYCREGFTAENNKCVVAPAGTSSASGCPSGMSPCPDGYCYELDASPGNCGSCGHSCPAGTTCSASTCTSGAAAAPVTSATTAGITVSPSPLVSGYGPGPAALNCGAIGRTYCSGTCVDTGSDEANCGSCGSFCNAICCTGACVDAREDPANCGSCGHQCPPAATCWAGSCRLIRVTPTTTTLPHHSFTTVPHPSFTKVFP